MNINVPVALRPLALPAEHGGWGFLCEPIALGLLAAPSWGGALLATAAVFGFLTRQPLKLALQDAVRGRSYPRTPYCRALAATFLFAGAMALAGAFALSGARILVPLALAVPLAVVQIAFDATSRSRELLPEFSGAAAMTSVAAAIAIAGGRTSLAAYGLAGILLARFVPAILYVRALFGRLFGRLPSWAAVAAHGLALAANAFLAPPIVTAAMAVLLIRAVWGVTHPTPHAKTVGWREIVFGAVTVILAAIAYGP